MWSVWLVWRSLKEEGLCGWCYVVWFSVARCGVVWRGSPFDLFGKKSVSDVVGASTAKARDGGP